MQTFLHGRDMISFDVATRPFEISESADRSGGDPCLLPATVERRTVDHTTELAFFVYNPGCCALPADLFTNDSIHIYLRRGFMDKPVALSIQPRIDLAGPLQPRGDTLLFRTTVDFDSTQQNLSGFYFLTISARFTCYRAVADSWVWVE